MSIQVTALNNDSTTQSLQLSLDAAAMRHQAIATNLANLNTPGFKRLDLSNDFQSTLTNALQQLDQNKPLTMSVNPSIGVSSDQGPARLDGNTVSLEQEMMQLANNQAQFTFAAQMIAGHYKEIKTAITGTPPSS